MKKLLFSLATLLITLISFGQSSTYVNGYTRSNGTYVQSYYRTMPNSTRNDNYSTIGNINPYTGTAGTKPGDSYYSSYSNSYNTPSYSTLSSYSTFNLPASSITSYSTYSYPSYSTYTSYSSLSTYSSISSYTLYNTYYIK